MGKGVKHYFPNGREHLGGTHKHPDGTVMTGKVMSKTAKKLLHYGGLSNKAKQAARKGWKK
jgi:hypothetical protein